MNCEISRMAHLIGLLEAAHICQTLSGKQSPRFAAAIMTRWRTLTMRSEQFNQPTEKETITMPCAYLVTTSQGERLIKANSKAQAVNFAVRSEVKAETLTPATTLDAVARGLKVEDATTVPDESAKNKE